MLNLTYWWLSLGFLWTLSTQAQVSTLNEGVLLDEFAGLSRWIPKGTTHTLVLITLENHTDTLRVTLDTAHRVVHLAHKDGWLDLDYRPSSIAKRHQHPFPNYFLPACFSFETIYELDGQGLIAASTTTCTVEDRDPANDPSIRHQYALHTGLHYHTLTVYLTAPEQETEGRYQLDRSGDHYRLQYLDYPSHYDRPLYRWNAALGRHQFRWSGRSRQRYDCSFYTYSLTTTAVGHLQTPLYGKRGEPIGQLSILPQ